MYNCLIYLKAKTLLTPNNEDCFAKLFITKKVHSCAMPPPYLLIKVKKLRTSILEKVERGRIDLHRNI